MSKKKEIKKLICGIVMPISAIDGCSKEHWGDVLKIIKESILDTDFEANLVSNADDIGVIQKRIIQNLYENPIVVCDVSANNPNVMLELGMRLAFDKPTIVIIDDKTKFSFDTSTIEHLIYPRDLRFNKIVTFKNQLKEKIKATYQKSLSDPNYTTFLKHFGSFKSVKIDTKEVSKEDFIIDEIKELKKAITIQGKRNLEYYDETSILKIKIQNTKELFKYNYNHFDTMQHLLDEIWSRVNELYNYGLPAYDYGISWELYNKTTNTRIDKDSDINSASDYRTLEEAEIYEYDILELRLL